MGSVIMEQAGYLPTRVHFELGGKNPGMVSEDADLERVLDAVIFLTHSLDDGCRTSSSRALVQESIAGAFEAKLSERMSRMVAGPPLDSATEVGPLIEKAQFDKVRDFVGTGERDGATLAADGERVGDSGWFLRPAQITHAVSAMRIVQEEVSGPVLTSIRFADEAEALRFAVDVAFGLAGYLWTGDLTRALRISDAPEAGLIRVDSENVRNLPPPFGGVRNPGIGRDGAQRSFDFYMEQKSIAFALGRHKIHRLAA